MLRLGCIGVVVAMAWPAQAATLSATPATVNDVIKASMPGDTIVLDGNFQSGIRISNRRWSPMITLRADKALIAGLEIHKAEGVRIIGGVYQANRAAPKHLGAFYVLESKNIVVDGVEIHESAIRFTRSENVKLLDSTIDAFGNAAALIGVDGAEIRRNKFLNMGVDGLDLYSVRNAVVSHNLCAGTQRLEGAHVDCIQIANQKGHFKSENIEISYNEIRGDTMGISAFRGDYRNINIHHNTLTTSFSNGISLFDTVDGRIWNNELGPSPGAKLGPGIRTDGSVDLMRCGNVIKGAQGGRKKDKKCHD